jgi:hypothetical protein
MQLQKCIKRLYLLSFVRNPVKKCYKTIKFLIDNQVVNEK